MRRFSAVNAGSRFANQLWREFAHRRPRAFGEGWIVKAAERRHLAIAGVPSRATISTMVELKPSALRPPEQR